MNANGPAIKLVGVTRRRTGQDTGTLVRNLSRCKEGMAQVLPSGYKVDANDILVMVQNIYALQWRGPGLSQVTRLSWGQEQKQNL